MAAGARPVGEASPRRLAEQGIHRYGFHGLSYEFILEELARLDGASVAGATGAQAAQVARRGRLIIAHLGSGASMAAVRDGQSVDTTMGFTPTGGLVMGTRSGDLDPAIPLHVQRVAGLGAETVDEALNHESGLRALGGTNDVRELLVHFRTRFAQADIESAIAATLERFEGQTGIRASFLQSGTAIALSPETQIQVLHIIQECLSNARKHAGAKTVRVEMQRGPRYRFRVSDDGRGFDPAQVTSDMHVGLRIMRERAHRIGGNLSVRSQPGAGTVVALELPLEQDRAEAA